MKRNQKGFSVVEILLAVVVIAVVGFIGWYLGHKNNNQTTSSPVTSTSKSKTQAKDQDFITANPLDLAQYSAISKFRSCEGHDFSGLGPDGQPETMRSMKHYLDATAALAGSVGKLKIFAPFDGTINRIEQDNRGSRIYVDSKQASSWQYVFFHSDPVPSLAADSKVTAGQLIGYGNLSGGSPNFDMSLRKIVGQAELIDTPFAHMASSVLAQFQNYGVTNSNISISKAERDASPCTTFTRAADSWIKLSAP